MIDRVEEQCLVELNKLDHFQALGLQLDRAAEAVDDGIDWHDLEALLEHGCRLELAIEILR
jgi:hypothetical protein